MTDRFALDRRSFLARAGGGLGMLALANLLGQTGHAADMAPDPAAPQAPRPPHAPARARAVIWLYMYGGPSSIDLFDPKPELDKRDGERLPGDVDVLFGNPGPL